MKAICMKAEHMTSPCGMGYTRPYLSWRCKDGLRQTAYEVVVTLQNEAFWSSGMVRSAEMFCLCGRVLPSRAKAVWRVRLWDENGESGEWSEACFELGITDSSEWEATWVYPDKEETTTDDAINRKALLAHTEKKKKETYEPHKRAQYYRKRFSIGKTENARLYITARGVYEAYINGNRVGEYILAPGPAVYSRQFPVQSYDVSTLLREGENEILCMVGDGWYRSCSGVNGDRDLYGMQTALLCQLMVGDETVCRSDASWEVSTDGPLRQNDLQQGEVFDARIEAPADWLPVKTEVCDPSALACDNSVPIVENESFPGRLIPVPDGSTVIDFGQNLAGGIAFTINAHEGQRLLLMCGETLDENGNFTQENFQNRKRHAEGGTHQMVEYICREGLNRYKTRFAIFGFRYAKLETEIDLNSLEISAFAVYSRMEQTGCFTCGNSDLNKLVKNSLWSMKGNFCGIPTDCPTRERAGWTGDAGVFVETGLDLMDSLPVFRKWLADCRDMQYEDGRVSNIAPMINRPGFMTKRLCGSTGWGDACILVPWALYRRTGDLRLLRENYSMMKRWFAFLEKRAKKMTLRKLLRRNPYRRYLIQSGIDYGEWCEPGVNNMKEMMNPVKSSSTAYFAHSGHLLSEISLLLGEANAADHYAEVADKAEKAFLREYTVAGEIPGGRQCEYVRALQFDLLPKEKRGQAAEGLERAVAENGYHLNTGFLSTPFLIGILLRYGYTDTAEKLLLQDNCPGWLYEVKKGATTIWENWDGVDSDSKVKASHNHYSYGAVVGSLIEDVCGIHSSSEGIEFSPKPIPGLNHASSRCETAFGSAESSWTVEGDRIRAEITVPANAPAVLTMQDGQKRMLPAGHHAIWLDKKVQGGNIS